MSRGEPLSGDWPAPGKLNLFLHVIARRDDGYHLLQTVFQFIDQADFLDFRLRRDGALRRSEGPKDLPAADDLTLKAAQALKSRSGTTLGVDIHLRKRLPVGGGVGGGSSDAATTLVALNELWKTGLSQEALQELALDLGADVPVFVGGRAAWGEGVGEKLSTLELPEPWYLVIQPPCQVVTREIFQAPELTRNSPAITITGFLAGQGRNDLEPVVRKRHPEVAEALDWLGRHATARLTGSGACVFAGFEEEAAARRVFETLPRGWRSFVARGRNRSPLLERLDAERRS